MYLGGNWERETRRYAVFFHLSSLPSFTNAGTPIPWAVFVPGRGRVPLPSRPDKLLPPCTPSPRLHLPHRPVLRRVDIQPLRPVVHRRVVSRPQHPVAGRQRVLVECLTGR